jgi:hypothetical protein
MLPEYAPPSPFCNLVALLRLLARERLAARATVDELEERPVSAVPAVPALAAGPDPALAREAAGRVVDVHDVGQVELAQVGAAAGLARGIEAAADLVPAERPADLVPAV